MILIYDLIYRLFWLIFCVLCWWGCTNMIKDVLINYVQYPIALTAETTYVDWQIPFPAVAFCITSAPTLKRYFILYDILKLKWFIILYYN